MLLIIIKSKCRMYIYEELRKMNRQEIEALMKDVYTSSEAAEYLNISTQRLNQLVHDKRIVPIKISKSIMLFLKSDLDARKITNVVKDNSGIKCE